MNCRVSLDSRTGWQHVEVSGVEIWFKGYLIENGRTLTGKDAARRLMALPDVIEVLSSFLKRLDGLFSVVVKRHDLVLAAVDRIASIPLLILKRAGSFLVFDSAASLGAADINLPVADNTGACLALAMSGYTIGRNSIYDEATRLIAGECLILDDIGNAERSRYYEYRAWETAHDLHDNPQEALESVLHSLIDQLIKGVDGRTIIVPLSAGRQMFLIWSRREF